MQAAVLVDVKKKLEIMELTVPDLLPGQVLVKVSFSGVCHSQIMEADGKRGDDRFLPHLLGHEATGVVEKVGPEVGKVKAGDPVVLSWIRGSGRDAPGAKYSVQKSAGVLQPGTLINSGGVTTFSNYTIVSENRCTVLPAGVPLDVGVLFGCALPTGAGIVMNEIRPTENSSIGILGLGGIGLSALLMAKALGCFPIVAMDIESSKLDLARELGADVTLQLPPKLNAQDSPALRKKIMELVATARNSQTNLPPNSQTSASKNSPSQGPPNAITAPAVSGELDYVVEASGQARGIEFGFSLVRTKGGLCVFASHPAAGEKIEIDPYDLILGRRLQGSWGGAANPDRDFPLIAEKYRQGKLPLEKLLTKPYPLSEINQALDDLRSRQTTRALIQFSEIPTNPISSRVASSQGGVNA